MTVSVSDSNTYSPMMQQYMEIKNLHKDCLLLFRMGDFYELFYEDAIIAAPALEIALTKRGKTNGQDIPMCGVPYHSVDLYINKLIKAGHKLAICEQLESPEEAKKRGYKEVVKRDVIRIITPGTLTEDTLLEGKKSNYLASLVIQGQEMSIAYADLSTMDFNVLTSNIGNISNDLYKLHPAEIIISDSDYIKREIKDTLQDLKIKFVTFVDSFFDASKASKKIQSNFNLRTLESLGNFTDIQKSACGSLIEYLCITQKKDSILLSFPKIFQSTSHMVIDKATQNNLGLLEDKNEPGNSLLETIDYTITNCGGRLLRKFLLFPSIDDSIINNRLDLIDFFLENATLRSSIRSKLKLLPDLERALSKLSVNRGTQKDIFFIRQSLKIAKDMSLLFEKHKDIKMISRIINNLSLNFQVLEFLGSALIDIDTYFNENEFLRRSYNTQLEESYNFKDNSKALLEHLKREYIHKTGISSLKIEFNNLLGYYIEVTKLQANKIDSEEFILRQSTLNSVRFVTNKLKELEDKILGINQRISTLENQIFVELRDEIVKHRETLKETANTLAFIDVVTSFAELAKEKNYCRPTISKEPILLIENGRHPIVEKYLELTANGRFIENDCDLNKSQNILLITGPNMAGKSTFLRQNALIAILAHMGSFVPATKATVGIIDRVFSRIGAGDNLIKGHSTFLLEMIETATILNQATNKSLVILDEIGRGTSTYDGMAIAWSCLEYIHNNIKARTLFSTHYHELTELTKTLGALKCYTTKIKEWNDEIIFMYKLIPGIASSSFGISVALKAGIPKQVVERSKEMLSNLLKGENRKKNYDLFEHTQVKNNTRLIALEEKISKIKPDNLSPKQALDLIYELKSLTNN